MTITTAALTAATLKKGETGIIKSVECKSSFLKNKLETMGVIKGAKIRAISFAPTGDPINYKIMDFNLALRFEEAEAIKLEQIIPLK